MKKVIISAFILVFALWFVSCIYHKSVSVVYDQDEVASVFTNDTSHVILSTNVHQNFNAKIVLQTKNGGKGFICFHTNNELKKGYRVAINNDTEDSVWWRKTGSLVSVRNLTKSLVRDGEWFTLEINVDGKLITTKINGRTVVEYYEPDKPFRTENNKLQLLSTGKIILEKSLEGEIIVKSFETNSRSFGGKRSEEMAKRDESSDEILKLHQEDFPVLDYHIHLKGGLTKEDAAQLSLQTGVNYAIAPNCGIGFPITNDEGVMAFLNLMRKEPFILAMQAEGREWVSTFSKDVRDEFDFVFTDALTFSDNKNRRTRLWIPDETWIENEEKYMDMIVDKICMVLKEPMDIYVNPCFLPEKMSDRYDAFWTEERMNKFVSALAESGKALEINSRYKIPNKAIILKAKAAGVKFTFGTNNGEADLGLMEYAIRMKKECGITSADMYKPRIKI